MLKPTPYPNGYYRVGLCRDGMTHHHLVHRLVARAFHGPAPRYRGLDGKIRRMEVRHLDGSRDNNRSNNLCWSTRAQNHADKIAHGTGQRGERNGNSVFAPDQVRAIRLDDRPQRMIAADYGVHHSTVGRIKRGERWTHV